MSKSVTGNKGGKTTTTPKPAPATKPSPKTKKSPKR